MPRAAPRPKSLAATADQLRSWGLHPEGISFIADGVRALAVLASEAEPPRGHITADEIVARLDSSTAEIAIIEGSISGPRSDALSEAFYTVAVEDTLVGRQLAIKPRVHPTFVEGCAVQGIVSVAALVWATDAIKAFFHGRMDVDTLRLILERIGSKSRNLERFCRCGFARLTSGDESVLFAAFMPIAVEFQVAAMRVMNDQGHGAHRLAASLDPLHIVCFACTEGGNVENFALHLKQVPDPHAELRRLYAMVEDVLPPVKKILNGLPFFIKPETRFSESARSLGQSLERIYFLATYMLAMAYEFDTEALRKPGLQPLDLLKTCIEAAPTLFSVGIVNALGDVSCIIMRIFVDRPRLSRVIRLFYVRSLACIAHIRRQRLPPSLTQRVYGEAVAAQLLSDTLANDGTASRSNVPEIIYLMTATQHAGAAFFENTPDRTPGILQTMTLALLYGPMSSHDYLSVASCVNDMLKLNALNGHDDAFITKKFEGAKSADANSLAFAFFLTLDPVTRLRLRQGWNSKALSEPRQLSKPLAVKYRTLARLIFEDIRRSASSAGVTGPRCTALVHLQNAQIIRNALFDDVVSPALAHYQPRRIVGVPKLLRQELRVLEDLVGMSSASALQPDRYVPGWLSLLATFGAGFKAWHRRLEGMESKVLYPPAVRRARAAKEEPSSRARRIEVATEPNLKRLLDLLLDDVAAVFVPVGTLPVGILTDLVFYFGALLRSVQLPLAKRLIADRRAPFLTAAQRKQAHDQLATVQNYRARLGQVREKLGLVYGRVRLDEAIPGRLTGVEDGSSKRRQDFLQASLKSGSTLLPSLEDVDLVGHDTYENYGESLAHGQGNGGLLGPRMPPLPGPDAYAAADRRIREAFMPYVESLMLGSGPSGSGRR